MDQGFSYLLMIKVNRQGNMMVNGRMIYPMAMASTIILMMGVTDTREIGEMQKDLEENYSTTISR